MLKGRWLIAVAFGLVASLAVAQELATPEDQPRQEERAADSDSGPGPEQQQALDHVPALQGIEAAIRDLVSRGDEAEQDRNNRDLAAQEEMARWAYWMFVTSAASVFLTFFALLAIIRTLHHTKRAADYAHDMTKQTEISTRAAMDAVEVTKKIGQADIRAYVIVAEAKSVFLETNQGKDQFLTQVTLNNCGKSQAENFSIKVSVMIENLKGEVISTVQDFLIAEGANLPPQQKSSLVMHYGYSIGAHQDVLSERAIVCALISVSYDDVFGTNYAWVEKRLITGKFLTDGLMSSALTTRGQYQHQQS